MNLPNPFKLAKLTIAAFGNRRRAGLPFAEVQVQYNPESLTIGHESKFPAIQGIATSSAQLQYAQSRSKTLAVKLVFDGTGADELPLFIPVPSVAQRVADFLQACYRVQSATHEPAYLRLSWGNGVLEDPGFDCRLQSVDIHYTVFDRDGSPLRAELDASFAEDLDPAKRQARERLSSPDLTHRRLVRAGDTLPLLCREIYGSPDLYLRVAEVNGLDEIRVLEPGRELIFPPLAPAG